MINVFFALFTLFTILYFINIKNKTISNIIFVLCGIVLILVAGLREKGLDKDNYIYRGYWMTNNLKDLVENSFILIRNFVKFDLGLKFQSFLLIYAFLGVTFKLISVKKLSPLIWGSLLVYFSHYFLLHEFTQIRIGVATGFLLLSLYYLSNKNYLVFYIFAAIAIFFHQSCFFIVLFPLIRNTEKHIKFYYWLVPTGYLLYFFNTYLNINIPIPYLQERVEIYEKASESGFLKDEKTNVFNALFLIRIVILNVLLFYSKKISEHFPAVYLLVKIYAISLFTFLFLSKIAVFAFRTQELLGVVEIILIPSLAFIFPKKLRLYGALLVWSIALVLFLMDIFYVKLLIVK